MKGLFSTGLFIFCLGTGFMYYRIQVQRIRITRNLNLIVKQLKAFELKNEEQKTKLNDFKFDVLKKQACESIEGGQWQVRESRCTLRIVEAHTWEMIYFPSGAPPDPRQAKEFGHGYEDHLPTGLRCDRARGPLIAKSERVPLVFWFATKVKRHF